MKAVVHVAMVSALLCTSAYAQQHTGDGVEVKKQTANSASQTVVETPKTRKVESQQHVTDAMNTNRNQKPLEGPRDSYGVPVPKPPAGQGTNGSTDAMRAADKKH